MSRRILITLMALAVLNGCVYDKYAPDHCPQEGKTYYMSFVLSPGGEPDTKALPGSFEQADISEQLVSSVDLYFYTGGGTFQGKEHVTEFRQKPSGSSGDNVANVVYDFVVGLNFRPYRLLLVINNPTLDLSNLSLQDARTKLLEGTAYAGSSTSVTYRDASDVEQTPSVTPMFMGSSAYLNAAGVAICDNLIPGEYVWDNKPDALARPMHVYVERMAAKVTLKTAKKTFEVPVVTSQDNVTAKVDIEGWFLNGVNKDSYVFKQISESWHWSTWDWTNPTRYRSHWARDNSYGGGENQPTPFTQRSVPAGEKLRFYDAGHTPQQLLWSASENKYVGSDYCLENTADENALPVADNSSASLYSRITHVIVMARLRFALRDGAVDGDDPAGYTAASPSPPPDIFRYKGVFYTKKTLLAALRQDAGLDPSIEDKDLKMVSAAGQSWCPEYENGERVAVKRTDTDEVLSLTEGGVSVHIDGFAQGRFYYKIPVEHFNNGPVTSAYYPAGRYGVVRNHQYEITLNELTGIGTGIWDIGWDIRPYRKPDDYIVSAYMKVSPWKQLETRFLFVDPSGMLVTDGQRVEQDDFDWWE